MRLKVALPRAAQRSRPAARSRQMGPGGDVPFSTAAQSARVNAWAVRRSRWHYPVELTRR